MPNPLLLVGLIGLPAIFCILLYGARRLHRQYRWAAQAARDSVAGTAPAPVTEASIAHLPPAVQRYLRFSGCLGKPRPSGFAVSAAGKMKFRQDAPWADIRITQVNTLGSELRRIFFIRMRIFGIPMYGLHRYDAQRAGMMGRVLGLFKVLDASGPEMRISDTVTVLNDMCLFAPAALLDERITWRETGEHTAQAVFATTHCTVSADLTFGQDGRLLDFVSADRYYIGHDSAPQQMRWSTPVTRYQEMHGYRLIADGTALWQLPDGPYPYIRFSDIRDIAYF